MNNYNYYSSMIPIFGLSQIIKRSPSHGTAALCMRSNQERLNRFAGMTVLHMRDAELQGKRVHAV